MSTINAPILMTTTTVKIESETSTSIRENPRVYLVRV
jgi:hypothetical protein